MKPTAGVSKSMGREGGEVGQGGLSPTRDLWESVDCALELSPQGMRG